MAIARVLKRDVVSPVQRMLKIISSFATDPLKPLSLVSSVSVFNFVNFSA
jgi:hypothetical protein